MHHSPGTRRNLLWVLKQTPFSGAKRKIPKVSVAGKSINILTRQTIHSSC